MVSGLNIARIAKLVALFGFVLPWVLVSCSGQPLVRLSGLDLATGHVAALDAVVAVRARTHAHPNLLVALSLALVVAGLAASFLPSARQAAAAVIAAAAIALATSLAGVLTLQAEVDREIAAQQSGDRSLAGLIRIELQDGYFVTAAGLLAAVAGGALALARRPAPT